MLLFLYLGAFALICLVSIVLSKTKLMVALLSGFAAKETTLATLGVLYHVRGASLVTTLSNSIPFPAGLSFFVFSMFYIPCLVTTVTVGRETASWRWTLFSAAYALFLAVILSFVAYNLALVFA